MKENKYCDIKLEDFLVPNEENFYFSEYLHHLKDKKTFFYLCRKAFNLHGTLTKTKGLYSSVRYFMSKFKNFCRHEILKNSSEIYQVLCWQEWQEALFHLGKNSSNFSEEVRYEILIEFLFISGRLFKTYKEEVSDFYSVFEPKMNSYHEVILNTVKNHLYEIWQILNKVKEDNKVAK